MAAGVASQNVDIELGCDNAMSRTSAQKAFHGNRRLAGATDGFSAVSGQLRMIDDAGATAHGLNSR